MLLIQTTHIIRLAGKLPPLLPPTRKKLRLAFPRTLLDLQHNFRRLRFVSVALTTCVALSVRLTFFATSSTDAFTRSSRTNSNSGGTIQRRSGDGRIKPDRVWMEHRRDHT